MIRGVAFRALRVWSPLLCIVLLLTAACREPRRRAFVTVDVPVVAITNVRVIDGTGNPGKDDQTVILENGRIGAVGDARSVAVPAEAYVVDARGHTLIPGLVGMHEHLFYQNSQFAVPAQAAFARLYLASGVTTIRTAGTVDFDGDLRIKRQIDSGAIPGPKIHVTGPYLHARSAEPDPEGIAREVASQADRGATSFKAYMTLRASELKAAIQEAHTRGLRVTGHLCAVGFREAAAMGLDNVEHGLASNSDLVWKKEADVCPGQSEVLGEVAHLDVATDRRVHQTIATLVRHGVAVTSTLAVYETFAGDESALDPRTPSVLARWVRKSYESARARWVNQDGPGARAWAAVLTREMQFERAFVAAGGRLIAGVDPTGWGGVVAGFGDQRELELLVEAGLTPEMAIRVATSNGADFLYETDRIGTIEVGKQADLVAVRGNPSARIADVRNVVLVFKDGIGYDPEALIAATQGAVGRYDRRQIFHWPFNLILVALISFLIACIVLRRLRRRRAMPANAVSLER